MTVYASVEYAKSIMGSLQNAGTQTNISDEKVLRNLRIVSARIDREFQQRRPLFAPWIETRLFPLDGTRVSSWNGTFRVDGSLLALTSLSVAGNAVTAVEGYPDSATPPFPYLRLTDCCQGWYDYCSDCCDPRQVSIAGVWGLHSDYSNAWLAVDALAANITDSATTLTVADAAGDDAYGQPYRISAGHLLKISSEYLEVVKVEADTVTVVRGVNGSTKAAHTAADVVYRWGVEEPVQRAVARQAGLMYARQGVYTTMEVQGMSEVRYPADWLQEVRGILQGYAYGI